VVANSTNLNMKKIKKVLEQYVGIAAIVAAIFYIIIGGNIHIGGVRFRVTYLVVAYVFLKILYKFKSRVSYGVTIGLLGLTSFFLLSGDEVRADWSAVTAYIFLIIGILWQIIESFRENHLTKLGQIKNGTINATSRRARKAQQSTTIKLTSFRSRLNFGVSIFAVSIITVALLSPSVTALFADNRLSQTKQELRRKKKQALSISRKGAADSLNIKVVDGNKIPGEVDRIVGLLKRKTKATIGISKSKNKDYPRTIMRYRIKHTENATGIVNHLSNEYFVTKTGQLSNISPIDIELILGWDKKSLMKSYKVEVVGGGARRSDVLLIAALLKKNGFTNTTIESTNYSEKTRIRYNRSDKNVAKIVAEVLDEESEVFDEKNLPIMTPARFLPIKTITIILGP